MSVSIERLAISGIRSFSPSSQERIVFFKPLTLIVGHNGAGKTSIIECLRYACTGEMPPNSQKGALFVHDPHVANQSEVKATVQLLLTLKNGSQVFCSRQLQVSQTATGKLKFTSVGGSLTIKKSDGTKVGTNYRCVDLNKEVPYLMGVSKAILESVVFCHQEESNWPLGEPKELKQRFDDIFDATKYTKAIQAMKLEHKEQKSQVQLMERDLLTVQEKQKQLREARASYNRSERKAADLYEEIERLRNLITRREEEATTLRTKHAAAQNRIEEWKTLRFRLNALKQQYDTAEKSLEDDFGSEDTRKLQHELANLDRDLQKEKDQQEKYVQMSARLERHLEELRGNVEKLQEEGGSLNAQLRHAEQKVAKRDSILASLPDFAAFVEHGKIAADAPPGGYPDQIVDLICSGQRQLLRQKERAREAAAVKARQQLAQYDQKVNHATVQVAEQDERLRSLERERVKLHAEQIEMEQQLSKNQEQSKQLQQKQTDVEQAERALSDAKTSALEIDDDAIREFERKREQLSDEIQLLNNELGELSSQAHLHASLASKKNDLASLENDATSLISSSAVMQVKFLQSMRDVVQTAVAEHILKSNDSVERADDENSLKRRLKDEPSAVFEQLILEESILHQLSEQTHNRANLCQKELEKVRQMAAQRKAEFDRLQKEDEECKSRLHALENPDGTRRSLPESMLSAEKKLSQDRNEKITAEAASNLYGTFVRRGEEQQACPLCKRGFSSRELQDFTKRLEKALAAFPDKISEKSALVARGEEVVQRLRELKPAWDRATGLLSDLPTAESNYGATRKRQLEETKRSAVLTDLLSTIEKLQRECAGLKQSAQTLSSLHTKRVALELSISELEQTISKSGTRTVEQIQKELGKKKVAQAQCKNDLDVARAKQDASRVRLHEAESSLLATKNELLRIKGLQGKTEELQRHLKVVTSQESQIVKDIAKQRKLVDQAHEQHKVTSAARQNVAEEQAAEDAKSKAEIDQVRAQASRLDAAHRQEGLTAVEFGINEAPREVFCTLTQKLEDQQERIDHARKEIEKQKQELVDVEEKLRDLSASASEVEVRRRKLNDALKVRRMLEEVEVVQLQVQEGQQVLVAQGLDPEKAQSDLDFGESAEQLKRICSEYDRKIGQRETLLSEMKTIESTQLIRGRRITEEYEEKLIELVATKEAVAELDRYCKATDAFLMRFHTEKMEEINSIIKALWQASYNGNDIDTIRVTSDAGSEAVATTRTNYNYRLVMVKNGSELDMRGRCSAGQKVLASLIVRLALAETFCTNCGILALDEPTTNLDNANIRRFADSLIRLIKERASSHLQLIVITHDEDFVQQLGRSENADSYWRVEKNERQHSTIRQQPISDL